ncbi:hypothetical protein BJF79_19235 [Actinomadura sp. CNU-125]|uniref:hypothetical protein n=1 Tax=Actinomadura sp. CNU-125 TaxID=1904961 RepID=UPI00096942FE|nr:hypothetical protein [Actinomadura sp. CNU-125]OLT14275.1 hypothetical protein BJF79_19235 [Actinomadura sp. CNU-125]
MKSSLRLRRLAAAAVVAIGTAVTGTALAAPATAEELPEFDFSECPALPDGANPLFWGCTIAEVTGGTFVLGNMEQPIESPIRMVYANGFDAETLEQTVILGSFEADWTMAQEGLWGDRFLTAVYAKPEAVGMDLDAGIIKLDLKLRVYNPSWGTTARSGTTETRSP